MDLDGNFNPSTSPYPPPQQQYNPSMTSSPLDPSMQYTINNPTMMQQSIPPQQPQYTPINRLPPPSGIGRKAPSNKGGHKKKGATKKGGSSAVEKKAAAAAAARKKKITDIEVTFDTSNLLAPLPVNLTKIYAKHSVTNKWYEIKILERKERRSATGRTASHDMDDDDAELFVTPKLDEPAGDANDYSNHPFIYYGHYVNWDRRMDEWITRDRIRFPFQIQDILTAQQQAERALHRSDSSALGGVGAGDDKQTAMKQEYADEEKAELIQGSMPDGQPVETQTIKPIQGAGQGSKHSPDAVECHHDAGDGVHATGNAGHGHGHFSEEDLRAHEEATKVKNIDAIQFGQYRMTTWYYSPFPIEYNRYKTLWFCEFCLAFFGYESELRTHSQRCTVRHPPGNEIYRSKERNVTVAVFEIDGQIEKVYSQNLCYIGKLYLDHKTLEYDCTPFLFYVVCEVDSRGYHPVGYFSKEKHAASAFNLACILTLPCHQRKGYGKFIISLSYELSKIEERVGSPEKPISDLGQQAYSSYWSYTLIQLLAKRQVGELFSIEDLSRQTCITCDDIIETLKLLKVLQWYQGRWVFSETQVQKLEADRIRREEKLQKQLDADPTAMYVAPCRPELLHWTAYVPKKQKTNMQSLYV